MSTEKMKICISILTIFFFISCSGKPPTDNAKAANIKANNEETALTNEVSAITRTAQKLEKQGRGLEIYRNSKKVEALRECRIIAEGNRKEISDLEVRIQKLADNYKSQLAPLIPDLNECGACSPKAMDGCVKARASINKAIKEIYPQ